MPTSNVNMYAASMLTTSNSLAPMSSTELSLPPIDDGCIDVVYKITPGALDPDGDILHFQLQKCKSAKVADIKGYLYPQELDLTGQTTLTMNPNTGVIIWDKPTIQGEYNILFKMPYEVYPSPATYTPDLTNIGLTSSTFNCKTNA